MYLKSLTVRGFKSFASATTLTLEPGITCIVGPNGSGKSNVVDALSWVMGEQGVKSLRGGKMEDVIFSGTSGRPPLGRAEVVLTIDNSDGALPVDYAEVTVGRTMFRNGGSDYAINGTPCRLLDVQELLSDSGIGREMHVIVGQGQLDSILHATAEDRRGFVEEAAGVLKHRKRKDKALRKLDSTEGNLTRLGDLLGEIRRQLKPLGRQAEVARRASVVQMRVRDARARLLADDAVRLTAALEKELAAEYEVRSRRAEVERRLDEARGTEADAESDLRATSPALERTQDVWYGVTAVRERLRSTASLASERLRNLRDGNEDEQPRRSPEQLEAEVAGMQEQEQACAADVAEHRLRLTQAVQARQRAEAAAAAAERDVTGQLSAAADRRESLARLAGQVSTLRSRAAGAEDEIGRLTEARQEALDRCARAQREFTALETKVAGLDAGERGLDAELEAASMLLADLDERLAKLRQESQGAESERSALKARTEALQTSTQQRDGGGALLGAAEHVGGLAGLVADRLSVRRGFEPAVAAALGPAAEALAVEGLSAAIEALDYLKAGSHGRAGLLVSGAVDGSAGVGSPRHKSGKRLRVEDYRSELPAGTTYAVDVVEVPDELAAALLPVLESTVIVDDLAAAQTLVEHWPDLVAVTGDGDRITSLLSVGGSADSLSALEMQAAVEEARDAVDEAAGRCERLLFERTAVEREHEEAQGRVAVATAKLYESDAVLAAVAEELSHLNAVGRSAKEEANRIATAVAVAKSVREEAIADLAHVEARLGSAEAGEELEPDTARRDRLAEAARTARQGETQARLAMRTAEERQRAVQGQANALARAAEQESAAVERTAHRLARRMREAATASAVAEVCQQVLARIERTVAEADRRRVELQARRAELEGQVIAARQGTRDLEAELASLTDSAHHEELLHTEYRLRREQLELRSREELGLDFEALVADYGPDQPVPSFDADSDVDDAEDDEAASVPYVRANQEAELRAAEGDLAQLGRINPLALEEFSALEERHRFLSEQLEDLRKTRRDLLDIVKEVDSRVEAVFAAAYSDVAREFGAVFERLFPGGEGRLVLTEPDDILTTGIEVEARPAGKRVKRLSLLSGGERSLVAVAFLVALFKARPSPFYILDEVEAALDDTNLGRLLEIYEELRETSQLLVITHQKRTMTIADALYGVSMRDDGVSTVISQRLREPASA